MPISQQQSRTDKSHCLRIELGRRMVDLREVSRMKTGAVLEFDCLWDEDVDVCAAGRCLARGEVIRVDGKIAVRIREVMPAKPAGWAE